MPYSSLTLRSHAQTIWQAGLDAVNSERLVRQQVRIVGDKLAFGESHTIRLDSFDRVCVVGGGKAAAGLAVGIEAALQSIDKPLSGWVNVPSDCLLPTNSVHLHGARPPGINEPTAKAAEGTAEILRLVSELGPRDLCIALIAGGGSALLPAPVDGVSLDDKLQVTRLLSGAGADIHQLNTVRKQLSRIKGGGLARTCKAGQLVTLIVSDVLGDPLDVIASGPTVPNPSTAADALTVLKSYAFSHERLTDTILWNDALTVLETLASSPDDIPESVWRFLQSKHSAAQSDPENSPHVTNLLLANNDTALHAAAEEAAKLGYFTSAIPTNLREPTAEIVGGDLLVEAARILGEQKQLAAPLCIVSGGEPVVQLAPKEIRGKGGRNQQLALAVLQRLITPSDDPLMQQLQSSQITFLSGGTDGEDGPTDAAGAILWPDLIETVRTSGLDVEDYLRRNDAYTLLASLGALLMTGPTHTNVCDVRVMLMTPN